MLVENGEVKDKMRVVVGTAMTPTYPMASRIYFAILNPYWNVAEDLVKKIVAPRVVAQGPRLPQESNYEAVDKYGEGATVIPASSIDWKAVLAGTEKVKMRQKPGSLNSMGKMKFPFANDFGIFLHDTANKPQFASDKRANSNGCIRLEDASKLARWLFGTEPKASGDIPTRRYVCPSRSTSTSPISPPRRPGVGSNMPRRLFARSGGDGVRRALRANLAPLAASPAWHLRRFA